MELNNEITVLDIINKCNKVGVPSNNYINLEFGTNATLYTAPANGYYVLTYIPSSGTYFAFENETTGFRCEIHVTRSIWNCGFMPVQKGQKIRLYHDVSGEVQYFRFIYND